MRSTLIAALITFLLIGFSAYANFYVAPQERTMGDIQRIFYLHVSSAWVAFFAFLLVFLGSVAYLVKRTEKWDRLSLAAAEVGLVFCSVMLTTGPIWAKPVWGIWWTWDARLTSAFVLWLLYASYLLLRSLMDEPARRAVVSAVFGIFAFLDVPLVYFSIRIWRTQHPQPVIAGGEGSGLDPEMRKVLYFACLTAMVLMITMIRQRYRLEVLRDQVLQLSADVANEAGNDAPESSPGHAGGERRNTAGAAVQKTVE